MSLRASWFPLISLAAAVISLSGCSAKENSTRIDYQMGEKVKVGPLTYTVIESSWRSQLGNEFKVRLPQQRFLMINIGVTNGGGREVSVPMLTLENESGNSFLESDNGEGVENWVGILRTIAPAQTMQGRIVFDVPLGSYKLRLTDAGPAGTEKYTWVQIPLRMDTDLSIPTPDPSK